MSNFSSFFLLFSNKSPNSYRVFKMCSLFFIFQDSFDFYFFKFLILLFKSQISSQGFSNFLTFSCVSSYLKCLKLSNASFCHSYFKFFNFSYLSILQIFLKSFSFDFHFPRFNLFSAFFKFFWYSSFSSLWYSQMLQVVQVISIIYFHNFSKLTSLYSSYSSHRKY